MDNEEVDLEPPLPDVPTVARLAAVATVAYAVLILMFFSILLWIMATTGEPLTLNPHRYNEAPVEAGMFALLSGVACYGVATLDYVVRGRFR